MKQYRLAYRRHLTDSYYAKVSSKTCHDEGQIQIMFQQLLDEWGSDVLETIGIEHSDLVIFGGEWKNVNVGKLELIKVIEAKKKN
jgi:hypothetical protein